MLSAIRSTLRGRRRDDTGATMLVVIGYGAVLVLAMGLLSAYTVDSMKGARREQDYYRAIEAAQGGVDDLIAKFTVNPAAAQPAPGWSGWLAVPGSVDASGIDCVLTSPAATCPQYRYRIEDDAGSTRPNAVTIRAEGKARDIVRAVKVNAAQRNFGDYLYFSDVEAYDPSDDLVPGLATDLLTYHRANCAVRAWDNPRPQDCNEPIFRDGDSLTGGGRIHSNDAFLIEGEPTFEGPVSTALPSCASKASDADCYRTTGDGELDPDPAGITYDPTFGMPVEDEVLTQIKNGLGTCVYTGPTRIKFENGGMRVWSPRTPPSQTANGSSNSCGGGVTDGLGLVGGILGTVGGLLNLDLVDSGKFVTPVPAGIYVDEAPPLTDPSGCRLNQLLGFNTGTPLDLNLSDGCTEGDLHIDGVLDGRTTAAADNDIVIVSELTYQSEDPNPAQGDLLGLIARNNVEIYNPLQCTLALQTGCLSDGLLNGVLNLTNYLLGGEDFELDAAIVALNGRFGVQLSNLVPNLGPLTGQTPKLKLNGSVAQRHAGYIGGPLDLDLVGSIQLNLSILQTGFVRDYTYDTRLRTQLPAFFPAPANAPFERGAFAEVDVEA